MSELNASNLRKENGNEGPDLVGVTELTSPYFMVPPSGTTEQRPQNPQKGTLRFNTDIGSLEYYRGDTIGWESINRTSPKPWPWCNFWVYRWNRCSCNICRWIYTIFKSK